MSKFLGPIHHWLYHKIELQNNINKQIALYNGTFEHDAESYVLPTLEEAIDTANIHGWLQQKVDFVEEKLANNVAQYLAMQPDNFAELKTLFYKAGREVSENRGQLTPKEFYQLLNDTLLDGMPCDHVNRIVTETDACLIYQKTSCVHKKYWETVGVDSLVYHNLREEFIRGMAENLGVSHQKTVDDTFVIERI